MVGIMPTTAVTSSSSTCGGLHLLPFPFKRRTRIIQRDGLATPSSTSAAISATATATAASDPKPWLFVGLGNPGKIYQGTRHNVGFEMIDVIAEAQGISVTTINSKSLLGKGYIGDVPVMLAKPQTFMNSSGWVACFIFQNTTESSASDI